MAEVINTLNRRGLEYTIPNDFTKISFNENDVVYTDLLELAKLSTPARIVLFNESNPTRSLEEAIIASKGRSEYKEVAIGIDPGRLFTVAAVTDGELASWLRTGNLSELIDYVNKIIESTPSTSYRIRIGCNALGLKIARILKDSVKSRAVVELVSEKHSSPSLMHRSPFVYRIVSKVKTSRRKDLYAAVSIALRRGQVIENG
ncbi:MAG: hypothetical protein N3E36_01375 [Sulfolobales archaeon]|nr:hypothetical protein [Sulfolobales archaeon]MCX8198664.1 hypothetical protein [Sulfolobales archaeon]MDW8169737.1 hypothetical protein [Desulfurococcaceae archaeon]